MTPTTICFLILTVMLLISLILNFVMLGMLVKHGKLLNNINKNTDDEEWIEDEEV